MATYFMNIDTFKYWNEEKKSWVDTTKEATDFGHRSLSSKPKNSVRIREMNNCN